MSKTEHGKIDGQFVPLLHATLDCPAWRGHVTRGTALYMALKRRVPRERNRAFISYRDACKELGNGRHKIREWFAELEHYGFIVLAVPGSFRCRRQGQGTPLATDRTWATPARQALTGCSIRLAATNCDGMAFCLTRSHSATVGSGITKNKIP